MGHKKKAKTRSANQPALRTAGGKLKHFGGYQAVAGAALTVLLAMTTVVLSRSLLHRSTSPVVHDETTGYVDSASCAGCHQDVAESFSHTGMSHSISEPGPANMVGDFSGGKPLFHQRSGNYYRMFRRPDGYYIQRYQIGYDKKPTNEVEERIDYVVGSGDHARSYLHRNREGRLMELPVTWYTERGGYWAMTPGYDGADQKDLHGFVSKECIFCHDAYPKAESKEVEASGEPIFSSELPQGVDCQRCHGPGAKHERTATDHPKDEELIRSSIVNPAHLSRDRQLEVCMECHLSTSGSQDRNISLRSGRDVFSYRPGEPLANYKLYFDSAEPKDKEAFPIADAAYRLRMSACFQQSSMTCLTCHDPHDQLHGTEATEHYIEACEGCHQSVKHTVSLPSNQNCLTCHMPKRRGEVAIHTVLTDHYIQRNKPGRDLLAAITVKDDPASNALKQLALYYPAQIPADPETKLDLEVGVLESGGNDTARIAQLKDDLKKYSPTQAKYYAALGRSYGTAGDLQEAVTWLQAAANRSPRSHDIAGELAEVSAASGDLAQAQTALERITSSGPQDARLMTNLADIYAQQGAPSKAEAMLQRALAAEPELGQTYNLLGTVKERAGDSATAEHLYREAIRYRPDLAEARCNLAKLLIGKQRYDEAEFHLRRAIEVTPQYAEAHHVLGLLLLLRHSYPQAEGELRAAIQDDPKNAVVRSDLGDLLAKSSRTDEALEQYRQALQLNPDLSEANLGAGLLLRSKGFIGESRTYCSKAASSPDPSLRSEAMTCLQ